MLFRSEGFRGAPAVDADALANVICRLSEFAADQSDRIAEARATADSIVRPRDRAEAMAAVAAVQAQTGDFVAALATARAIADDRVRMEVLLVVADSQAKAGDIAGALATARTIDDATAQSAAVVALEAVAIGQARAGDVAGALRSAEGIDDYFRRTEAQAAIARVQAERGDIVGARETAQHIRSTYWVPQERIRNPYRFSETNVDDYWHFEALRSEEHTSELQSH